MFSRRKFLGYGFASAASSAFCNIGSAQEMKILFPGKIKLLSDRDALLEKLKVEAERVFETNRVRTGEGLFHLPSAGTYRSFFAWDSGWNVISLSMIDPELALKELETIFSFQAEDGHIPHEVRIPELSETDPLRKITIYAVRKQYDDRGRSHFIDPPSFLIAAGVLYERTRDDRVLELLPAMQKCVDNLTGPRDLFGDGLVSIVHPWESGTDSAPVFDAPLGIDIDNHLVWLDYLSTYPSLLNHCAKLDWDLERIAKANRFVFEDVGVNSIAAAGIFSMAQMYHAAGQTGKAEKCRTQAEGIVKAMEEILWDDEAAFFYPRYDLDQPRQSKRKCVTGMLPLITGLVSADKAKRVIDENLCSPEHFNGPWLVPFNSISEVSGEKVPFEQMVLWRGRCIWINMNWMAARAAANYGREDFAKRITKNTARMVLSSGFREFYDPATGAGMGAQGFTWPALVLDMIERYGV